MSDPTSTPPASPDPHAERLKSAYTAFKKRWKVTRLDDESKLGGGRPTTSGRKSDVAGIQPPNDFPREIWQELAKQGRIKDMGGGFYAMP